MFPRQTEVGNNDSFSSFWYFLGRNIRIIKMVPTWKNHGNLNHILPRTEKYWSFPVVLRLVFLLVSLVVGIFLV